MLTAAAAAAVAAVPPGMELRWLAAVAAVLSAVVAVLLPAPFALQRLLFAAPAALQPLALPPSHSLDHNFPDVARVLLFR